MIRLEIVQGKTASLSRPFVIRLIDLTTGTEVARRRPQTSKQAACPPYENAGPFRNRHVSGLARRLGFIALRYDFLPLPVLLSRWPYLRENGKKRGCQLGTVDLDRRLRTEAPLL